MRKSKQECDQIQLLAHALEPDAGHLIRARCVGCTRDNWGEWCSSEVPYPGTKGHCTRPPGHKGPHIACHLYEYAHYNEIWTTPTT